MSFCSDLFSSLNILMSFWCFSVFQFCIFILLYIPCFNSFRNLIRVCLAPWWYSQAQLLCFIFFFFLDITLHFHIFFFFFTISSGLCCVEYVFSLHYSILFFIIFCIFTVFSIVFSLLQCLLLYSVWIRLPFFIIFYF